MTTKIRTTTTETRTQTIRAGTTTTKTYQFTTLQNTFAKRDDYQPYPTWFSSSYEPSRVSSACSCLVTPPLVTTTLTVVKTTTTKTTVSNKAMSQATWQAYMSQTTVPKATATVVVQSSGYCGVPGCSNGLTPIQSTFNEVFNAHDCIQQCRDDPTCVLVNFGFETNPTLYFCNRFTRPLNETYQEGSSTAFRCGGYRFYDVGCNVP